jgi:Cytochrome P450
LKPGDRVLLCWVSGNLDETVFENPEEVDFDRANKRHMAFGLGLHRCIGSNVARLEFRIMFEQILSRMPDFRVEEAGLRPSPVPAIVAGRVEIPKFCFRLIGRDFDEVVVLQKFCHGFGLVRVALPTFLEQRFSVGGQSPVERRDRREEALLEVGEQRTRPSAASRGLPIFVKHRGQS